MTNAAPMWKRIFPVGIQGIDYKSFAALRKAAAFYLYKCLKPR